MAESSRFFGTVGKIKLGRGPISRRHDPFNISKPRLHQLSRPSPNPRVELFSTQSGVMETLFFDSLTNLHYHLFLTGTE